MKLEGSLDAFGLPDIFQLLSYTKKTGGLHLHSGVVEGIEGIVYFASGAVTGATADCTRNRLGRRLVGQGGVAEDALASAVERARAEGVGVVKALVDAGAADRDVVRSLVTDEIAAAVAEMLSWEAGSFAFSGDEPDPDDVGVALATDAVVAEARDRGASGEAADGPAGAPELVLALVPRVDDAVTLSADEWALLTLVDGRRDVSELAELTGSDVSVMAGRLSGLLERGVLREAVAGSDAASVLRRQLDLLASLEEPVGGASAAAATSTLAERPPAAPAAPAPVRPTVAAVAAETARPDGRGSAVLSEPAEAQPDLVTTIGGAHVPQDVVPPRPEPFLAPRQPDHPEDVPGRDGAAAEQSTEPAAAQAARTEPAVAVGDGPDAAARPAVHVPTATPPIASVPSGPSVSSSVSSAVSSVSSAPSVSSVSSMGLSGGGGVGGVNGSAAMAADPDAAAIERDPSVNRSLLLRLIAGVRGL